MPMIDAKTARDLDDLKRITFINFRELEKMSDSNNTDSTSVPTNASGRPVSVPSNTFDIIYLKDANTHITRNSAGDMVFHDANAGEVTLSDLKNMANLFWSWGSAFGIYMQNAAGTKKRVGITEDADGLTYFNDTDEVE